MGMKWAFWIAAGLIAYTYVGYAGWLRLRALWSSRTVKRGACLPTVSVVMVVRNEAESLRGKLSNLVELDYPADRCEIIVVSDGSTDETEAILREHGLSSRLKVKINPVARGKAAGLNDAVELAQGELIVFTDARQKIEAGAHP